jgi:hypothetical protein
MSSNEDFARKPLELGRDVVTTADDVQALRESRRHVVSWLQLSADQLDALLPPLPPDRRRAMRPDVTPFSLE